MKKELVIEGGTFQVSTCKRQVSDVKTGRHLLKHSINIAALISLIIAYVYGYMLQNADYQNMLSPYMEGKVIKQVSNKPVLFEVYEEDKLISYCGIQEEVGYGGPLLVATEINLEGDITSTFTLDHKETLSFYRKLENNNFFKQFPGMKANSLFTPMDVDVVSGATISSEAFVNTIERTAHFAGRNYLGLDIQEKTTAWKFGINELGLLLLFGFAFIALFTKKKILTSISLGISFVYLGFYLNASLSISSFAGIMLGYFPEFKTHLLWWLLVGLSIGSVVLLKKNVYCSMMCPFHATQKGLIYVSGMKFRLPPKIRKLAKHTSKFLLWVSLMLIFLSSNPTLAAYEPFAMMFSLDGIGVQWYILPAALIGSLFISDFFCKYFCPVGRTFTYLIKFRKTIDSLIKIKN